MKNARKGFVVLAAIALAVLICSCLFACGGKKGPSAPALNQFTGITFKGLTVDYDGEPHKIEIEGTLPEGADVKYTDNEQTKAGTYEAKAELTCEGYETKTLKATLTINKINVDTSALTWSGEKEVDYDTHKHSLTVIGDVPEEVTVKYLYSGVETDGVTDAGTYEVKCVMAGENYKETVMTDTLVINKLDIDTTKLTWNGDTNVEYDSRTHSLAVMGDIPAGVTATYYYNDVEADGVVDVGTYTVKCVLTGKNYNTAEMTATLKITSVEKQLYTAFVGSSVYFQNDLDGEKLYAYAGGTITKINNDVPNYMIADGSQLYYMSKGLFSNSIKNYNGSKASVLFSLSGEYLISDGTNLYYAVNNLLMNTDKNGIYKIAKNAGEDAAPTKLTSDKAEYLAYCGGYVYYSNASEGGKLYRISVSATNVKGEKLSDEQASFIMSDGTNVYYNSTKTLVGVGVASAVTKYVPSTDTIVKLTADSGKYLTKVGSYIYYINNDKLTSTLFGDGIYRVSAGRDDSSLPSDKIISVENGGYSSLTSDGTHLYYYKLNDKHLYRYDVSASAETDLMASFTLPQETVTLSGYANVVEYEGEIYYTNPRDNSRLYKYNPSTKSSFLVLDASVSNVYFNDGYMYYSTFVATNYALFRMDMTTHESEKILGHRYENLRFEGGKIYGIRIGASFAGIGAKNSIVEIDPVNKTETEIYKSVAPSVLGFAKAGNDYYYISSSKIYKYDGASKAAATIGSSAIAANNLSVYDGRIYYYDGEGLKSCTLAGDDIKTLYTLSGINDMRISGGKVYFSAKGADKGVYEYDVTSGNTEKIDSQPACGIAACGGKVYFIRTVVTYSSDEYPSHDSAYDGKLYCYDGSSVTAV